MDTKCYTQQTASLHGKFSMLELLLLFQAIEMYFTILFTWANGLSLSSPQTFIESFSPIEYDLKMQLMINSYGEAGNCCWCHLLKLSSWL